MIKGRTSDFGQLARPGGEPVEECRISLHLATLNRVNENRRRIVRPRILDTHLVEESLHDEFDDFLCPTGGQVPATPFKGSSRVFGDFCSLSQKLVRALVIRHSATVSPGRQSGFRSQYQLPSGS